MACAATALAMEPRLTVCPCVPALPSSSSRLPQAHASIRAYGVHLVVANLLATRKETVYLVTAEVGGCLRGSLDTAVA